MAASRGLRSGSAPSRGKAGGERPGGERGWGVDMLQQWLTFIFKGFGDRAGFPGAREPITVAQPRNGCKSY